MTDRTFTRSTACTLLCASVVMLAGCNKAADSQSTNPAAAGTAPASASTSAQQPAPYAPPSADQLYQMVAPIALFPDKLLAQVLAGSTYPDQISAADGMLQQHPNLTGALLTDAVNPEPWDPSVKGLTQFPSVLDQMAQNIQWTTSLGEAYVNDPADVMNAIQVMRQRAQNNGSLRSSAQMQVVSQPADSTAGNEVVAGGDEPPVYSGPAVVPPPAQTIEIMPAQPDTVYVPQYDPETVYGAPVATYPGYTYVQPAGYSTGQMVTAGVIGFGVGVVVAALLDHHGGGGGGPGPNPGWGWNSWGMNWGAPGRGPGGPGGGGWQRPAVVHNNNVYVSRSTTVVNRYVTNNINNSRTVNNVTNNRTTYNNSNNRYANNGVHNTSVENRSVVNEAARRPATQAMATTPHFGTPVRGAEPARFQQARTTAQPATRPAAANEAPREVARPAQAHPAAAAVRNTHPAAPAHAAAPRPVERTQERPVERPAARAPERPAPQPQARPEQPQRPAAHPAPAHHAAAKPAPKKPAPKKHQDDQH